LRIHIEPSIWHRETDELVELIHERDTILNNLEEAEARYIASFRTSTPDPSIMEIEETVSPRREDSKPQISRPRALTSSAVRVVISPLCLSSHLSEG
jgi:hypothetical protein